MLKVFEEASHCMASVSIKGRSTCVAMVTITLFAKAQRICAILKLLPKSLATWDTGRHVHNCSVTCLYPTYTGDTDLWFRQWLQGCIKHCTVRYAVLHWQLERVWEEGTCTAPHGHVCSSSCSGNPQLIYRVTSWMLDPLSMVTYIPG